MGLGNKVTWPITFGEQGTIAIYFQGTKFKTYIKRKKCKINRKIIFGEQGNWVLFPTNKGMRTRERGRILHFRIAMVL